MPDADRFSLTDLHAQIARLSLDADFWSLRFVDEITESFTVRKNIAMAFTACTDRAAMAILTRLTKDALQNRSSQIGLDDFSGFDERTARVD